MKEATISDITPWQERNVEQTLKLVSDDNLEDLLCIGFQTGEFYALSSKMSRKDALWLIELTRDHILNGEYES